MTKATKPGRLAEVLAASGGEEEAEALGEAGLIPEGDCADEAIPEAVAEAPTQIDDTYNRPELTGAEPRTYTREFKIYCASVFLTNGLVPDTAKICGVDYELLKRWVKLKWWPEALRVARQKFEAEITANLSKTIQKAQEAILERIENGDTKITRDGEVRVPVGAKDLAVIQAIAFDKRQIISGAPTSISRRAAISAEGQAEKLRGRARGGKKGRIQARQELAASASNVVPFEKKA